MVVIDAGGGTVDISGYAIEDKDPLRVEEIFASECMFTSLFHAAPSNVGLQAVYLEPQL